MQLPDEQKVNLLDTLQKDLEERKVILARRDLEHLWKNGETEMYNGKEPNIKYGDWEKDAVEDEDEVEMTDEELIEALKNM